MKLITIRAPEGMGKSVVRLALEKGVNEAAVSRAEVFRSEQHSRLQEVVDIETATPIAKAFIEALMAAPFYDPQDYSFTIRHPESLFGAKPPREEIHPIVRPTIDVYEELYQFIKITPSLIGRVFLSALLLSYGMVEDHIPLVIAGLLFLPYHHHMLGVALGSCLREWRFLGQALLALLASTLLIFIAGVLVSMMTKPPVLFEIKGSPLSGAVLAVIIGVAAGLGSIDDAGRRELIGLAATAHISILPAWLGLQVVFGESDVHKMTEHLLSFFINVALLTIAAIITYAIAGMKGEGIRKFIRHFTKNTQV